MVFFAATLISIAIPNGAMAAGCCDVAGDADSNGVITLADPLLITQYLFANAATPSCLQRWDADGSGKVTVRDVVRLVRYVVASGTAPVCPATELNFEERTIAFNAVDSIQAALHGLSPDSVASILFAFMNGRSEFSEVGREGTSVWARFVDGPIFAVANNRFPDDTVNVSDETEMVLPTTAIPKGFVVPKRLNQLEKQERKAKSNAVPQISTYEMPESVDAYVINTLGSPCFTSAVAKVRNLLGANGYSVATTEGTVPDLLTEIQNAGVFYIDAHGVGFLDTVGFHDGAVWTSTIPSHAGDSLFAGLLATEELIYLSAYDLDSNGVCREHTRYAFTSKFVQNYMTFSENSLVFMNTCLLAGGLNNQGFELANAFMAAGASVYTGWSEKITASISDKAGEFLIDRMLGANASTLTPIESPKQRPFDITQLKTDMHNRGFDVRPSNGAELTISKLQGSFELLAPSLRFVEVINYTDTLFLTGYFGSDPGPKGHVYVDGVEQTIYKWEPQYIWASIPQSGVGSSGPVTVIRDGDAQLTPLTQRKSNPVNLTDWYGTFTYTENNADSLRGKIEVHAHIRADVHAFREAPHTTPAPNQFIVFGGVKDSDGSASASGTFIYPVPGSDPYEELTWAWSGTDSLGWVNQPDPQGILLQGTIKASFPRVELLVFGSALFADGETITSSLNGPQGTRNLLFSPPFELYDNPFVAPYTLYIDMHPTTWNILAGSRSLSVCCSVNPDNTGSNLDLLHKIEWNMIPASFGPDATAAQ
jgi:hypothetical protein